MLHYKESNALLTELSDWVRELRNLGNISIIYNICHKQLYHTGALSLSHSSEGKTLG